MATLATQSVNQPLVSILIVPTTSPTPSTTENAHITPTVSTDGPAHQTPRPRLRIAIPDEARNAAGQRSRRPRQWLGGSPPPPPSPPHNTPTVRFGTEIQGPSILRGRRALQRLSPNGALRPVLGQHRRQRANRAPMFELENVAADTNNVANMNNAADRQENDARQATAELEHAMLNDPYMWSRASYPANWVEYNDRVQHSEGPWLLGA